MESLAMCDSTAELQGEFAWTATRGSDPHGAFVSCMDGMVCAHGRDGPAVRTNPTLPASLESGSPGGTVETTLRRESRDDDKARSMAVQAAPAAKLAPEASLVVPAPGLSQEELIEEYMRLVRDMRARGATAEDADVRMLRRSVMQLRGTLPRKEKLRSPFPEHPGHPKTHKLDLLHAGFLASMSLLWPWLLFTEHPGHPGSGPAAIRFVVPSVLATLVPRSLWCSRHTEKEGRRCEGTGGRAQWAK